MVTIIEKRSAHQKFLTRKLGTIAATSKTKRALITKVKSPKVKMFMGKERKSKTGLISAFTIPKTKATINAETTPPIETPDRM